MATREVIIASPVRTAIGKYGGSLGSVPAEELGAAVIRESVRRSGIAPDKVGSVVMGNVIQAGNKMNPARQAAVHSGLPVEVPAVTVNRVCGSGAEAIVAVAKDIWLGFADAAVAGGMENMDRAPYLVPDGRRGHKMGHGEIFDSMLRDGLYDAFSDQHNGWHVEATISEKSISRDAQDQWATRSHQRFSSAQAKGRFKPEIHPVEIASKGSVAVFEHDESVRPLTNVNGLSRLRPAFREDGSITAGNASGLSSGASAMIVAEKRFAERSGIEAFGKLASFGIVAIEPEMFGLAPILAIKQALERADWTLGSLDRVEINEAYAAVPLAVSAALGLPHDIVNVDGGAIAHGHPIGATGAILVTRLLHSMRRDSLKRGIVTLCIGGGQAIALALEI